MKANDDEILYQQQQLDLLRRKLAYNIGQQRELGASAPFSLVEDIREAREDIARVKATLRGWGVAVDDRTDDAVPTQEIAAPVRRMISPASFAWGIAALAVVVIGVLAWRVMASPAGIISPTAPIAMVSSVPTVALTEPPTSVPTLMPTLVPTVAPTLASTESPTVTPVFVVRYPFDVAALEQTDFVADSTLSTTIPISGFLTISALEFGLFGSDEVPAWKVRLKITNTSPQPIHLDLSDRFFEMNDDQGRAAEQIYFCCNTTSGELLGVNESREVQLMYRSVPGWYGKSTQAHRIFIRVSGLLPVVRAVWSFAPLATAD